MLRQPGRQLSQDTIHLFDFGMLEGEDFIVELDGFLRLYEGGAACIALSMKDALHLPLLFRKNCDHPPAVQERLFDIGHITRLAKPRYDPVEKPAKLIATTEKIHPDFSQFLTRIVTHGPRLIKHFVN